MEHLDEHEHAFIDENGVVIGIAVFDISAHNTDWIDTFMADEHGHEKVVCCCTYGKPYIGDTWDEANKKWIETANRFPKDEPKIIPNAPKEINSPNA